MTGLVTVLAVAMTLFHVYTASFGVFPDLIQRSIHLGFALVLCFALKRVSGKRERRATPWYDKLLMILSAASTIYVVVIYRRIVEDPLLWVGSVDKALAIIMLLLVLESSRRTVGWTFVVMVVVLVAYACLGPNFPGIWAHPGFSIEATLQILYHSSNGIWGMLLGISASMLAIFAVFGAALTATGGGETFIELAEAVTGGTKGGPAKVAVVASALFGMISGSAAANVVTTGTFTIPAMKKAGFKPAFAGAVEAVASTGGQIMPPILGAGAFIMAQILGIPYLRIAAAAALPAFLYFFGAFMGVHLEASKYGIGGTRLPADKVRQVFKANRILPLFVPIAIFMYFLLRGYTPTTGGVWASLVAIVMFILMTRPPVFGEKGLLAALRDLCLSAAGTVVEVAALLASAQIVVSLVSMTGLGVKLSDVIVSMGKGNVFLSLVLSAVVCIILGMGLPTTAAYVLGASVLGPALISLGVPDLVAHLFIFYFAIISTITPPVCAAVFLGAGLAGANWMQTAWAAVRLGLCAFIVPFAFAYSQALLLMGPWSEVVLATITSTGGVFFVSVAAIGYCGRRLPVWTRPLLVVGGVLMIVPGLLTDLMGLALSVAVLWVTRVKEEGARATA